MRTSVNRHLLLLAQTALGDDLEEMVLVGGAAVDLLVDEPGISVTRGTADVDLLVEVATRLDLHEVERRLGRRGLLHPMTGDAPICRWQKGALTVDVMPTDPELYGFGNRWARLAFETALLYEDEELRLRHVSAPAFIALKVEAYRSPGRANAGDAYASHDLGDILAVLDGRETTATEIAATPTLLREAVAGFLVELAARGDLPDVIESHILDPDRIARVVRIVRELGRSA